MGIDCGRDLLLEATSVFSFSRRAQLTKIDHRKPMNIIDKYNRLLWIGFITSILIMRVLLILSIFIGSCKRFMRQERRTRHFARSSSPHLALRTRFALRANCCVRLAWLIKRLLGRLACTRKNGESDRISFNFSFQEMSLERVVHVSRVLTDQTFRRIFSKKAGHVKTQAMKIAD